jgi:hypothetical protein
MAMLRPKSQNLNIEHDSILSMRNFLQMTKNHIPLQIFDCSDPVNDQQQQNVLSIALFRKKILLRNKSGGTFVQ